MQDFVQPVVLKWVSLFCTVYEYYESKLVNWWSTILYTTLCLKKACDAIYLSIIQILIARL